MQLAVQVGHADKMRQTSAPSMEANMMARRGALSPVATALVDLLGHMWPAPALPISL